MNRYELTYIIDVALEESDRKALIERISGIIEANGGEIAKVDETFWGKRRLAYPINYKTEGWYVLVTFCAPGEAIRELERNLEINESVLRYLTVKLEEKQSKVKPRAARPAPVAEAPAEPAAEAPEAPAAEAAPEAPAAEAAPEAPADAE